MSEREDSLARDLGRAGVYFGQENNALTDDFAICIHETPAESDTARPGLIGTSDRHEILFSSVIGLSAAQM